VNVFDASALLAFLQREDGEDVVRTALQEGGVCGAANWAEVAQKTRAKQIPWGASRKFLLSFDLTVVPVTLDDAERAAELWESLPTLSLADRLCLALGASNRATVLTADQQWGGQPGVRLIR